VKFRALTKINHDNIDYFPGETIELNKRHAEELLKCGAVEPLNKPFAAKSLGFTVAINKGNENV
jgi:hypothetical protein